MIILALDTSLGPCSVALLRGGEIIAKAHDEEHGQQSRKLVPMIEALLGETNLHYADCDAVACTIGPGGFTGIRTGLTTARAIALAAAKPLIGVSTLEVIAWSARDKGDVLATINAHREQWYAQRFRVNGTLNAISGPMLVDEKGKKALGHGSKIIETIPTACDVAALAHDKWTRGEREFPKAPLYIREPDAKLPAKEGLKIEGKLL